MWNNNTDSAPLALKDYDGRVAGYTDELLETLDTKAKGKPFNASKYFNYYSFDIMGVSIPIDRLSARGR